MTVSLYSNEYVARIEQDRKEAMSLMLAVIYGGSARVPLVLSYGGEWR